MNQIPKKCILNNLKALKIIEKKKFFEIESKFKDTEPNSTVF